MLKNHRNKYYPCYSFSPKTGKASQNGCFVFTVMRCGVPIFIIQAPRESGNTKTPRFLLSVLRSFTYSSPGCSRYKLLKRQSQKLTHYRPAMPFGNRNKYFRGSFQFSIVTIKKIITHLETRNSIIFSKLKTSYFNGINLSNSSYAKFHSKYYGLLWVG